MNHPRALAPAGSLIAAVLLGGLPRAEILYAVHSSQTLVRIDTDTMAGTWLGSLAPFEVEGLTYDSDGTLYSLAENLLLEADPTDGQTTEVGSDLSAIVSGGQALAEDPLSGTLYGVLDDGLEQESVLVTFSKFTGVADRVGGTGLANVTALAFDSEGRAWGVDTDHGLVRIDASTGAAHAVNPGGLQGAGTPTSLTIGPDGTFWSVAGDVLLTIDPDTGTATSLGTLDLPAAGSVVALASGGPRGACELRNLLGINPEDFSCVTAPRIGSDWVTAIEESKSPLLASQVVLGLGGATNGVIGNLKVLVKAPYAFDTRFGEEAGTHVIRIPREPGLVGQQLYTQGARLDAEGVTLLNAQDLLLGY